MSTELKKLAEQNLKLKEELQLREGLPHLYGQKFYGWQRTFFESTNRLNILTAGNQSGKSSVSIRKCIHWATEKDLWPTLWTTPPKQMWYLYPDYGTATREFETKWVPQFLPRGEYQKHWKYGWTAEFDKKEIKAIRFNSGVNLYFLAYAQMAKMLQASTVHAVFCDEEIPSSMFSELRFRLMAVRGHFHAAFTATLGQEFWRAILEERGEDEIFPDALKLQIDIERDCRQFEDGSLSHWTDEAVREAIAACPTEAEVLRRIRGRFVMAEGRRYPSFNRAKNVKPALAPPLPDWLIYAGVDLGSGTDRGHPSAITFVAVRPDFKFARVFRHWNGKGQMTTAADVFQKFLELRGSLRCVSQCYDYSARDFGTIAQRAGEAFIQAKKDRELGDNILNSLFKNEMLVIDEIDENQQLIREVERANDRDRKTTALDDSVDSARYACAPIPFDWSGLNPELNLPVPEKPIETEIEQRMRFARGNEQTQELGMNVLVEDEISFWQEYLDA